MQDQIKPSAGMGSIPSEKKGVTFRVWAPNADQVFVTGSFNDWNQEKHPLSHEENGYWATFLPDAKDGDEYKYVIINGDQKLVKNDPYARKMQHSSGNSVIYQHSPDWEDKDFSMPDFNKLVIYELHIGTFNRPENKEVGDFYAAAEKLDHLVSLGINAIEIMPVMEFEGNKSWGYNPACPFAIETDYGGPEGLVYFVNEAHKRGIAVIMDVIFNHFGPGDLDLWQFDGWHENGKGGIYFYNNHLSKTPWGENRPDYGRQEVCNYLRDNAFMWLEVYHCDGLRYDATAFIRYLEGGTLKDKQEIQEGYQFLQMLNKELREKHPHKILIAEDLKFDSRVTSPIDTNGLGFHTQWGPGFEHSIKRVLKEVTDRHRNLQEVVESLLQRFNNDAFQRVIFTESHDSVANGSTRLPEEISPGDAEGEFAKKKSTLGALLLFTSPGIPMIFQGQEFLAFKYFSDDQIIDWGRVASMEGITQLYMDLIRLRKGDEQFCIGLQGNDTMVIHFNQENLVIAYQRIHHEHKENPTTVILNFSHHKHEGYRIGIGQKEPLEVRFNSGWQGYDKDFSKVNLVVVHPEESDYEESPYSILVDLPAYGGIIMSK
ncbi:alpha-amylase family glycosyl hydrolase [Pleomorphovibrio marinus]|uniref:alpha-amylase family glycosyl hydrolase n=1 Tax=Pleomorphovibrio marinus TaxID=2164132 RepID=UPI000E0C4E21|nr:alpha-amylase family glycosyl hydrolase [Pleomorphovibrio marinus]